MNPLPMGGIYNFSRIHIKGWPARIAPTRRGGYARRQAVQYNRQLCAVTGSSINGQYRSVNDKVKKQIS